MKPVARTDRLVKQVVDNDTLVYDPGDDTACCLNALASEVWRQCDGRRSVDDIVAHVGRTVKLPDGLTAEEAVWRALSELEDATLIAPLGEDATAGIGSGMKRRDLLKGLAMAGMFPAVQKITAPSITSAMSPAPSSSPPAASASSSHPVVSASVSSSHPLVSASLTPAPTQSVTPSITQSMTPTVTPTMFPLPSVTPSHT